MKETAAGIFVTGTGTGIGKTYVSRLLTDAFALDCTVTYMKPVQTGCVTDAQGRLSAPDFEYVMEGKACMTAAYEDHVPYRFEPACSPHLAASLATTAISLDTIMDSYRKVAENAAITIVEGAGGILAPISETTSTIDIIQQLGIPVVLVTCPSLGTLNHTFLTVQVLGSRGIRLAGIVCNNVHNDRLDFVYHDNIAMIRKRTHPLPFLEVSHGAATNCDPVGRFCQSIRYDI